jgi:arylsulfatase A-like enzyme
LAGGADLVPTLLDLAGQPVQEELDGCSLVPVLEGREPPSGLIDRFLIIHTGRWEKGKAAQSKWAGVAIRSQRFRLVNNEALYDLAEDPGELQNVLLDYPGEVSAMRRFYDKWWEETLPLMINE